MNRFACLTTLLCAAACDGTVGDLGVSAPPDPRTPLDPLPPNQPPAIDTFGASATTGIAPLTVTLSWAVSDPDGDALTCALNDAAVDCALMTSPFTAVSAGAQTVTLKVTDAGGLSTTQTVTLTAVQAVGDVKISKVEYGQTVVSSSLKLVASKAALLRVYVQADHPNLTGCTVEVTGTNNGTTLGTLTLTGPASPPTADDPTTLAKQWTVEMPSAWVATGLALDVTVDAADAIPETDETNNTQHLTPSIGKANVLHLMAVPVMHQGSLPTIADLQMPMTRIWPLASVDAMTRAPYTTSQSLTGDDTDGWANLLDEIASLRQSDGSSRDYYGFVHVSYGSGVAGIGYIGQGAATGRDDSIETAQHELGHNMGRQHAPCGGAAGPDPSYPYAGAKIGSYGYDNVAKRLLAPKAYVDLMSYCDPSWVSDYNYSAVQRSLEAMGPGAPPSAAAPFVRTLQVSGHFGDRGAVLRPVHRVTSRRVDSAGEGGRQVRVRFASGVERVVALETHEVADLPVREDHFVAQVEDLGALASIELLELGRVVAAQHVRRAAEAPRFEVRRVDANTIALTWDADRWPHAAVAVLDGVERTTLGVMLSSGTALLRTDRLERIGELEVSLSDGADAASARVPMP